ncbi:MAG: transposase [Paracoccaceae bacterium]
MNPLQVEFCNNASGAYNPRGKGTGKPMIFVAASREGQARARVVPNDQRATPEPGLLEWIDPETTSLMTDGSKSYRGQAYLLLAPTAWLI